MIELKPVEYGDYGPALVIKGRFKGSVVYYDDDEGNFAIIYVDTPFATPYYRVRHSSLVTTDSKFLPLERLKKDYPELCIRAGI